MLGGQKWHHSGALVWHPTRKVNKAEEQTCLSINIAQYTTKPVLTFQITAIVLAAVYKQQAETHTKEFFQHTLRKYYTTKDRRDAVTLSWDFMMAEVRTL